MSTYCYKLPDGEIRDEVLPMGTAPDIIRFPDGLIGVRCLTAEWTPPKTELRTAPGGWPRTSDALGCAPSQVKEFETHSREIGVPTHFTKGGEAIIDSPSHQKRYLKACGMRDRAAWC